MSDYFFWDGYLHWARIIERDRLLRLPEFPGGEDVPLHEPLFVRFKNVPAVEDLQQFLDPGRDILDNPERSLREFILSINGFEFLEDFAFTLEDALFGIQSYLLCKDVGHPLEFFVYRPLAVTKADHKKDDHLFEIIDVGAPTLADLQKRIHLERPEFHVGRPVIGALIDNDIGFLNQRLTRDGSETRIQAIWLQARERLPGPGKKVMVIGETLTNEDINSLIKRGDERGVYRETNTRLHLDERFHRPPPVDAHGSAVADLAFGAEPDAPGSNLPLLAVQLPPEAALDTSGTISESYIVQAFRWLCMRARLINPNSKLVVNLSYGALAGQKDGGKFLESQIQRDIKCSHHAGQDVQIVYAFGNSRNQRQVARVELTPELPSATLTWQIPPDNPVPSFVEIRAVGRTCDRQEYLTEVPEAVTVRMHEPGSGGSVGAPRRRGAASPPLADGYDPQSYRIYKVKPRSFEHSRPDQPGYLTISAAPTRSISPRIPVAAAGDWQIELEMEEGQAIDLVVQIQRGDTAPGFGAGYGPGGRQSTLEGTYIDTVQDGFRTRDVVEPLTNDGTQSAYTTAIFQEQIHTAGALRKAYAVTTETDYSAHVASWANVKEPRRKEDVDGITTRGHAAAGAYTRSITRLSGTSAAAALMTRHLTK